LKVENFVEVKAQQFVVPLPDFVDFVKIVAGIMIDFYYILVE